MKRLLFLLNSLGLLAFWAFVLRKLDPIRRTEPQRYTFEIIGFLRILAGFSASKLSLASQSGLPRIEVGKGFHFF
ncbi:MAG: hypothetical protein EBQ85_09225 [Proteobacteria bacterium]|nr:hypothetical protein [Pseudomonadota bacterium]